jgi:hypothetical protein
LRNWILDLPVDLGKDGGPIFNKRPKKIECGAGHIQIYYIGKKLMSLLEIMQYQIKFSGDPDEKVRKAKKIAAEQGVTFVGDGTKGKFSGRIMGGRLVGTYTVEKNVLMVTITEKPLLTTWNMIEAQLVDFLKS